jgi:lysophospholipase L1-like esterase
MVHVVLLGDSIFDNGAYVGGAPDVAMQLKERLPEGWKVTLRAVDGAVVRDVMRQLERLPGNATHLVLSAGGNDALGHAGILDEPAVSVAEVLARLAGLAESFEIRYRALLEAVRGCGLPTAVCTVYDPNFPDPVLQRLASTALTVFNDAILRQAFRAGVPVLDLRLICNSPADYANPIEPSARGGEKIARAIARAVTGHPFESGRTGVFV